jgi:hypothetical protein
MTQGYFRPLEPASTGPTAERTELRKRGHERKWETRWNGFIMINGIESETELFARAEKVDLAEKDAHEALAHSNDAEIAYLRKPNNHTRVAFEDAKTAAAVALEILDAELRWLASTRARTVRGLKLKASYVPWEGTLADSIIEDILQL